MNRLIEALSAIKDTKALLPFSAYSCVHEQRISNVPIIKPLLICVLSGQKELGRDRQMRCGSGHFVFLSNNSKVMVRNIPNNDQYRALIIEFDYDDFSCFSASSFSMLPEQHAAISFSKAPTEPVVEGQINDFLERVLLQFIEWSQFSPATLWPARRREILLTLFSLGYEQVAHFAEPPSLSHKVFSLIRAMDFKDVSMSAVSSALAMSESTLGRKLHAEGLSFQEIKDQVILGMGLDLVQTTHHSISQIAEQCGYHSPSRFTEKFKQLFHTTPSQLRKA
ncbi:MAG: helix-turn-helix transcriptional regulator [Pseudomonadota bacterium]|nr:helix-turn-helix transcriptional regulator [Pseudomonadota bacterium]